MRKEYWISRFNIKTKERYEWVKRHKKEGDAIGRAIDYARENKVDFIREQTEESSK